MSVFAEHETSEERETTRAPQPRVPLPVAPSHTNAIADEVVHRLAAPTVIRRFTLDHPDFTKTKTAKVFAGGASGNVAELSDGKAPLVVKANQQISNEVVVANNLHAAMGSGADDYSVASPRTRPATQAELMDIKAATRLIKKGTARNFVTALDGPHPTLLMERSTGDPVSDHISGPKHLTKAKKGAPEALAPTSLLHKVVHDPGVLTTWAMAVPADVVMGMFDRLLGSFNPQNFLFDPKKNTFSFVDNTQNALMGYVTANAVHGQAFTAREAFVDWAGFYHPQNLAADLPKLADTMWLTLFGTDTESGQGIYGIETWLDPAVLPVFAAEVLANKAAMQGWILAGLAAGKARVLDVLRYAETLIEGLGAEASVEALVGLNARAHFLAGLAPDDAWARAEKNVAKKLSRQLPTPTPSSSSASSSAQPLTPSPSPSPSNTNAMPSTSGVSAPSTSGWNWSASAQPSSSSSSSSKPSLMGGQRTAPQPAMASSSSGPSNTNASPSTTTPTPSPTPTPSSSSTSGSSGWKVSSPDKSKQPNFKKDESQ